MRIVGDEVLSALEERIYHHEKCRYAYISWHVLVTVHSRQALVEKHIRPEVSFEAGGKEIYWKQTLTFESAMESKDGKQHVVYKSYITVDGEKKDIRAIKTAIKHLARNTSDAMRKTARLVQEGVY